MSQTGKSLMSVLRVCARDDVIPVAGSRGANMSCCCCSFARFPLCFSGDSEKCPAAAAPSLVFPWGFPDSEKCPAAAAPSLVFP